MCRGLRRITFRRAYCRAEERAGIWSEYTFPGQTDLALQCILPGGGNTFSFEENFVLMKFHCFDSPKDLCQLWSSIWDQNLILPPLIGHRKDPSPEPAVGAPWVQNTCLISDHKSDAAASPTWLLSTSSQAMRAAVQARGERSCRWQSLSCGDLGTGLQTTHSLPTGVTTKALVLAQPAQARQE